MIRATAESLRPKAFVIDRCDETRERVSEELRRAGYEVTETTSTHLRRQELRRSAPRLIVCRLDEFRRAGTAWLSDPSSRRGHRLLSYTERGRPSEITEALRSGAEEVFEYPIEVDALCESARQIARHITGALSHDLLEEELVGSGRTMARLRDQILALSQLRIPVMLRGEPGVGRRHVARLMTGAGEPFIQIETRASPQQLRREPATYFLREVDAFTAAEQGFWAEAAWKGTGRKAAGRHLRAIVLPPNSS